MGAWVYKKTGFPRPGSIENPEAEPGSEAAVAAAAAEVEEAAAALGAGEVLLGDHEVHETELAACGNQHLRVRVCDFRRVGG